MNSPNRVLVAMAFVAMASQQLACRRLISAAIDHETGDEAGTTTSSSPLSASSSSKKKACDLVTDAEVQAASGKKLIKKEGSGDTCDWSLSATGHETQDGSMASISLQIAPEAAMAVIPTLAPPQAVPGVGEKAEWMGGMAPTLRVHMRGSVLNFMFADPQGMMKNFGIQEKKIDKNTTQVNMTYPELEKEAIAIGKAAAGRY